MAKYIKAMLFAGLGLVVLVFVGLNIVESRKEYIDGNILYLQAPTAPQLLPRQHPWITNGLTSKLLFRSLFTADHTLFNMVPDLASYEIIDGGYEYKITLFPEQLWSDGTEITLDDVIYSIETARVAELANPLYKSTFGKIASMEAEGNVLTIKMAELSTMLRPMLAQLAIMPAHKFSTVEPEKFLYAMTDMPNPLTSGMYTFGDPAKGYTSKDYTSLVINEHYNGTKPKIEEVRIYNSTMKNTPRLDYYASNNIAEMISLRAMQGYSEHLVDMLFYRYFVFNIGGNDGNRNHAMEDIRVRKAICMAIDRKKILHEVYFDMGNIVNGAGVIDALGPYDYNPIQAKQLLEESNYDLNRPLRFVYSPLDNSSKIFLDQAKRQLEEIGFKVDLFPSPTSTFYYEEREFDVKLKLLPSFEASEWFDEYSSAHAFMPRLNKGKGELDELIIRLAGETDDDTRIELLNKLAYEELDLLYKFPLFTLSQSVYINSARVKLPENFKQGNYLYKFDMNFEEWEIKKQ